MPCQVPDKQEVFTCFFAPYRSLSITSPPSLSLYSSLFLPLSLFLLHMQTSTPALDTFLRRLTCPGIPVIQAKPCQVEESLSQGRDRGGGGRGRGRGWGAETGAGKGDHIQAPGDRRLGVAPHCPPNINTLRFPASDGPDNHPLSTGTIWRQGGGVKAIFYFHKT